MKLGIKFKSISTSGDYLQRFNSLKYFKDFKVVVYNRGRRYIYGINICLPTGFIESDHGRDIDSRRSVTGYIFFLGSSPISWQSKQ